MFFFGEIKNFFQRQKEQKEVEGAKVALSSFVRRIVIKSRRLLSGEMAGDYRTAFRGSGLEFHQLREYQLGDDPRLIDWKGFARSGKLMVKEMVEERDRTVVVALDYSASMDFGGKRRKLDVATEVAAVLSSVALNGGDRVFPLAFAGSDVGWMKPMRGMERLGTVAAFFAELKIKSARPDYRTLLSTLLKVPPRHSIVFVISDFLGFSKRERALLSILSKRGDLILVRVSDELEEEFVQFGMLNVEDPETGEEFPLDLSRMKRAREIKAFLRAKTTEREEIFRAAGAEYLHIDTEDDVVQKLARFLHEMAGKNRRSRW